MVYNPARTLQWSAILVCETNAMPSSPQWVFGPLRLAPEHACLWCAAPLAPSVRYEARRCRHRGGTSAFWALTAYRSPQEGRNNHAHATGVDAAQHAARSRCRVGHGGGAG